MYIFCKHPTHYIYIYIHIFMWTYNGWKLTYIIIYHMIVRNDNSLTINVTQRHYLEFKSYAIEEWNDICCELYDISVIIHKLTERLIEWIASLFVKLYNITAKKKNKACTTS